ncbi:MAG: phenylacetate--CoA ligase family protein [Oscillatoria sp. PMC 1068.18]|nr:phenylacetate--CoA ligase family protein [Oscillatoria sp. PMC 1076.18]MEC4989802.1 phenylacetate--CoA ligase family protein [Oscillatoria sp. PMC 1068.18]
MQKNQSQNLIAACQNFLDTPLEAKIEASLDTDPEAEVLQLFHYVAATVPAYQNFLETHHLDPAAIQTFADFQKLPFTTKKNYLQVNSLPDLCRHGKIESCDFVAVSSGSTGKPSFWLRFLSDEYAIATRFEQIFHDSFQADQRRTLAVVCFTLGTWVGGMYTANCCRHLAAKGYPLTVVTPGNNKTEIFRVVEELAPFFDQVVLLGYPPFLKDVIDTGKAQGLDWRPYRVKLVMAGEVFSEEWRTIVGEVLGETNFCYDSASLYGTADAGVLGNETPLSICIRRFLSQHPDAARELFGESRLPTLVQYDPLSRFFETHEGTLLFSGDNGIPLLRYHISDQGGIISYSEMIDFLHGQNFDPVGELDSRGVRQLPFVYIFGRSHFTVSYFGANIYPENVAVGLEQIEVRDWLTGKFVMEVKQDSQQNPFLSIVVELAPDIEADESKKKAIATSILSQLLRLNSEFANYVPPAYQQPQIILKSMGDPEYFPLGVKHRYTRKGFSQA